MKIVSLMSVGSPFSRDIAFQIAGLGQELHVVDATNLDEASYINRDDPFQQESIRVFEKAASSVREISYRSSTGTGVLGLAWRLARILQEINPDMLLTIHGGAYAAAAYLSQFRPYTLYVSGSDVLFARHFKKYLSRLSFTSASTVFANGKYLASKAREIAPQARIFPLYMGTDTSKFRPGDKRMSPISIVCTRGFLPIYNNELLIHALAKLPKALPEYEVFFAAAGPGLEKARTLALEILSPAQRKQIKFLGGISREALAELLGSAHIYVSVSLSDGTSLSLMEAMASCAFPILSDIPANREWIDPAVENGILVPTDDPSKLAKALERAILDEHLRRAAEDVNRQLILERADLKRNMTTLVDELKQHAKLDSPNVRAITSSAPQVR
jgi:glycosyltransferase involved in cell wall biosynthesis